jgi:hypothetical protein
LPVTAPVTVNSYQVLFATAPRVPRAAPLMAGWLFQVTPVSVQAAFVINLSVPPLGLPPFEIFLT